MKVRPIAITSSLILPPSSFLSVVPVFGDELDGERLAVRVEAFVAVGLVGHENLFAALARAAGESARLDGRGVGHEAYEPQVVGAQPEGLIIRLDDERDARSVALYLVE